MRYIEIPKVIEATQVFNLSDHKALTPLTAKYDAYIPVQNGAFALLQTGEHDINFVMPGDYIITGDYDENRLMRKKYFELRHREYNFITKSS